MKLKCPNCGSEGWKAIEQMSAATPCEIIVLDDGGIEIFMDSSTEFIRDMATSVTVAYTCAADECGFTTAPDRLDSLKEEPKVQDNFDADEIIGIDNSVKVDALATRDIHQLKKISGNGLASELRGRVADALDEADEEADVEGHKAAAAANLARAQEMREAREADRAHEKPVTPALERLKHVFGG